MLAGCSLKTFVRQSCIKSTAVSVSTAAANGNWKLVAVTGNCNMLHGVNKSATHCRIMQLCTTLYQLRAEVHIKWIPVDGIICCSSKWDDMNLIANMWQTSGFKDSKDLWINCYRDRCTWKYVTYAKHFLSCSYAEELRCKRTKNLSYASYIVRFEYILTQH